MRLVFMGTPEFAVPSLNKLLESPHEIAGVVTVPDRPQGRGLKCGESSIKLAARSHNLNVIQPESLQDPYFLNSLKKMNAECFVVVGFRILPPVVFEMPPFGSFNLHASLLPKYRGAAPIQWAIINGEKKTGVTTFYLNRHVDTGEILFQESIFIGEHETSGELHDRLSLIGANLVLKTVDSIASGFIQAKPQQGEITPAPKIIPEMCRIDWNQPAVQIHNLIRGLSPRPGAYSFYKNKRIKFFRSHLVDKITEGKKQPGTVIRASGSDLWIQTGSHIINIDICQIEGKNSISTEAFLRGYHIRSGDRFDSNAIG